jgi:hypothetical protein
MLSCVKCVVVAVLVAGAGRGSGLCCKRSFFSPCLGVVFFTPRQMLSRVYTLLHANNPELMGRTRKVLKPPEICRVGSTRIAWVNFKEICDMYVQCQWPSHWPLRLLLSEARCARVSCATG